ncbi:hypothetical protein DFH06DRAFT_1467535 [Mycena polygramma]|nr:hypothetical protein DFH06DRAFT_1467535 [Mycena polygramma]
MPCHPTFALAESVLLNALARRALKACRRPARRTSSTLDVGPAVERGLDVRALGMCIHPRTLPSPAVALVHACGMRLIPLEVYDLADGDAFFFLSKCVSSPTTTTTVSPVWLSVGLGGTLIFGRACVPALAAMGLKECAVHRRLPVPGLGWARIGGRA